MQKPFFNRFSVLVMFNLLVLFGAIVWHRTPEPVITIQSASGPCSTAIVTDIVLKQYGNGVGEDDSQTLAHVVTNPNWKNISYVAFGTSDWSPIRPYDKITATLELGEYHIEWTDERNNPGSTTVKCTARVEAISNAIADSATPMLHEIQTPTAVQIQARSGFVRDQAIDDEEHSSAIPLHSLPIPTPKPEGYRPSTEAVVAQCLFTPPVGGIPLSEPIIPLDDYAFSEPALIVTNNMPLSIHQWLPDSKRLLVQRHTERGTVVELRNVQNQETTTLIEEAQSIKAPRWLPQESTLVWGAFGTSEREEGYWIHTLDPPGENRLTDHGGWKQQDISPDGKEFIFVSRPGTQAFIWNQETKALRALPVDLDSWRYDKGHSYPLQPFHINWHPSGERILFWDGTWAFLYDLRTDQGCEINMEALAGINDSILRASWSPNGRYLMAQLTQEPLFTSLTGSYALVWILDTYTGDTVQYELETVVYGFSWAPDNQTVIIEEEADRANDGASRSIFYLLNIRNGAHRPILTENTDLGTNGKKVLWSPDGKILAHQCKNPVATDVTSDVDGICIRDVTIHR